MYMGKCDIENSAKEIIDLISISAKRNQKGIGEAETVGICNSKLPTTKTGKGLQLKLSVCLIHFYPTLHPGPLFAILCRK